MAIPEAMDWQQCSGNGLAVDGLQWRNINKTKNIEQQWHRSLTTDP